MGALPCYAASTPMHAHTALTGRHSRIRLYIQERCCPGTATQTRTIVCTHLHAIWRPHTWHAGTRSHSAMPTPAARPRHLHCSSPPHWHRAVAASAPPQHARTRRQSASWCARTGEQACGQRRGHSDKSGLGRRRRSPAQGTLHSGHAPAQAHCNRGSHGRPPVLCSLYANACAHGPDAHDCVHTSPCRLWRAQTWHAGTRAHAATPTPFT